MYSCPLIWRLHVTLRQRYPISSSAFSRNQVKQEKRDLCWRKSRFSIRRRGLLIAVWNRLDPWNITLFCALQSQPKSKGVHFPPSYPKFTTIAIRFFHPLWKNTSVVKGLTDHSVQPPSPKRRPPLFRFELTSLSLDPILSPNHVDPDPSVNLFPMLPLPPWLLAFSHWHTDRSRTACPKKSFLRLSFSLRLFACLFPLIAKSQRNLSWLALFSHLQPKSSALPILCSALIPNLKLLLLRSPVTSK